MNNEEWKDGLPGVGVICEYIFTEGNQWRKGVCVAYYEEQAVIVDLEDQGAECCIIQRLRPIKRREPQPGEVWLIRNKPCVFRDSPNEFKFVQLDGEDSFTIKIKREYAAPSVKAYIAREIKAIVSSQCIQTHHAGSYNEACMLALNESARLDED